MVRWSARYFACSARLQPRQAYLSLQRCCSVRVWQFSWNAINSSHQTAQYR